MSLCELGCVLGVPGMVWHQYGGDVVLTDQDSIMSQLEGNVGTNFVDSFVTPSSSRGDDEEGDGTAAAEEDDDDRKPPPTIQTHPLT